MPTSAPYGSWKSPISAAQIAAGSVPLSQVELDAGAAYWLEGRPTEGGRNVLVRRAPDGTLATLTPEGFNVRTRAHEYGGGSYTVHAGVAYWSSFADQRLYRQEPGGEPRPITPEPDTAGALRYADGRVTPDGRWLVCVREAHGATGEPRNEIVALPTDGSAPPRAIVSGRDFFMAPRISPDGRRLAWLTWDHPNMPWDGTELWTADLAPDGTLSGERRVAGGPDEAIVQPGWRPADGALHFVSDRTGWWNVYRLDADGSAQPVAPIDADCSQPAWVFGLSTYAFLEDGRVALAVIEQGLQRLYLASPDGSLERVAALPFTSYRAGSLRSDGRWLWMVAASATEGSTLVRYDPASGALERLRASVAAPEAGYVATPRPITFPTAGGAVAHGLYYPPSNQDFQAPPDERPPLVVTLHGGPTSMAYAELDPERQYWTSRGFGLVAVNYRGSTGYGRGYRALLNGQWGVADVEDCVHAARYLADQGAVDGRRITIRGGSAGGYTTLCAVAFHPGVFAAGASYFGVTDLEALATDTHKFESRYLDSIVGPYPAAKQVYQERSPIHHLDRLATPLIVFQGLDDRVVPPSQAEALVDALRAKGLPYAYLAFEGEGHGFRRAETIQRTLEAELYFYSQVLGFPLGEPATPVEIANRPRGLRD